MRYADLNRHSDIIFGVVHNEHRMESLVDALARALSAVERDMQHRASTRHHDCILHSRPDYWLAGTATVADCVEEVVEAAGTAGVEVPPGLRHASVILDEGPREFSYEEFVGRLPPARDLTALDFEVVAVVCAASFEIPPDDFYAEVLRRLTGADQAELERLRPRPELSEMFGQLRVSRHGNSTMRASASAKELLVDFVMHGWGVRGWVLIAALGDPAADAAMLMAMAFDYIAHAGCSAPREVRRVAPPRADHDIYPPAALPLPAVDWRSIAAVIASRLRPERMELPPVLI